MSRGEPFRKVHNLTYLVDLVVPHAPEFEKLRDDVARLNPFAVDERYPRLREAPPADVVDELVEIAASVLKAVRAAIP